MSTIQEINVEFGFYFSTEEDLTDREVDLLAMYCGDHGRPDLAARLHRAKTESGKLADRQVGPTPKLR